jgi:hypothetical protein
MVKISGVLITNQGQQIPLLDASATNATESNLSTDPSITVNAQGVGDYMQGAVITHGLVTSMTNSIAYCYILRQGLVAAIIPIGKQGFQNEMQALAKPFQLIAGDVVRVLPISATSRLSTLSVYTNTGVCRLFVGTDSGAATTSLVDSQTGNSIGNTIQGSRVVMASFNSVNVGKLLSSGGAQILDAAGRLVGAVNVTNVQTSQLSWSRCNFPVELNSTAQMVTDA